MIKTIIKELFSEGGSVALPYIEKEEYPWLAIPNIKDIILDIQATLDSEEYYSPAPGVMISKGATVAPSAVICAPAIIMRGAEVRHCAYIRYRKLLGD